MVALELQSLALTELVIREDPEREALSCMPPVRFQRGWKFREPARNILKGCCVVQSCGPCVRSYKVIT